MFSFDEKTQCQALDPTQPSLPMKPGRGRIMTYDCKRNGTIDLFAPMNIATGAHACLPTVGVLQVDRSPRPARPRRARRARQLVGAQVRTSAHLARGSETGALASALHPDFGIVAELDRSLVLGPHPQGIDEQELHLDTSARRSDRRVAIPPEPGPATVRVDQVRRPQHKRPFITKVRRGRATRDRVTESATHHWPERVGETADSDVSWERVRLLRCSDCRTRAVSRRTCAATPTTRWTLNGEFHGYRRPRRRSRLYQPSEA